MPEAEIDVSAELVRRLLDRQHPDLAHLPITAMANGWDNVLFQLGDRLVVRLPRRELGAALVLNEQRWLPELAPALPLPIPVPVRVGEPGLGYPWSWSVVPLLPGRIAWPVRPAGIAAELGGFLRALHRPAVPDAPVSAFRGVPLARREGSFGENLRTVAHLVDRDAVLRVWHDALAAPPWDAPPVWVHGDLHPANVLVDGGRLSGVIDFGDLTSGDPATDLSVAWMLLPEEARPAFRQAYGTADEPLWRRARGWALALSLVFLAHSADNPLIAAIGRHTLAAVLREGGV